MNLSAYIEISENRFREEKGLYFEDYVPGVTIEHQPGRTITITDNIWQSLVSMNQHPLHIDDAYASQTEFSKILVSSLVTFNIINGMTVHSVSQRAIANLGWDAVRLVSPVFVGDTLYAETEILSKRLSKTRPDQGIVTVRTKGMNQRKTVVIEFNRSILVPCRPTAAR
ncbi:MaoC family dehydratase [Ralstonia pseudosolanacearum]|uniref:MaoC family dehydratase n=1 Tax=Ralstonia pseudosolanacearum TaxID=1310165 RepID=UPI000DAE6CFB|nr:MaoC family dehydratase [Ralstonia pseudosolanacearum]RAA04563.1 MaoC family dehydratase [Ralstonia pseudosolanacearum]